MAIKIIDGFDSSKRAPLNVKEKVADEAALLAIRYPFKGLRVKRDDNGKIYEYIGTEVDVISVIEDWIIVPTTHRGTAVPANTLGVDDDIYLRESTPAEYYLKVAGAWVLKFNFAGASLLYTTDDPPSDAVGVDGDSNINTLNGKVWKKIAGTWVFQLNVKGSDGTDGDTYRTTSTQTIDLNTLGATLALVIADADKDYTVGQKIIVANSTLNKFTAEIDSVAGTTLNLVDIVKTGTASLSSWVVNLDGAAGGQGAPGKAFVHTEADINLTDAKVVSVEADVQWTPENPWSASVLNDTRAGAYPPALPGSMIGKSIVWNGTIWKINGTWRGGNGSTPNISIGTVTTGAPNTPATATIQGITPNLVLNLTIPKGQDGANGLVDQFTTMTQGGAVYTLPSTRTFLQKFIVYGNPPAQNGGYVFITYQAGSLNNAAEGSVIDITFRASTAKICRISLGIPTTYDNVQANQVDVLPNQTYSLRFVVYTDTLLNRKAAYCIGEQRKITKPIVKYRGITSGGLRYITAPNTTFFDKAFDVIEFVNWGATELKPYVEMSTMVGKQSTYSWIEAAIEWSEDGNVSGTPELAAGWNVIESSKQTFQITGDTLIKVSAVHFDAPMEINNNGDESVFYRLRLRVRNRTNPDTEVSALDIPGNYSVGAYLAVRAATSSFICNITTVATNG